MKTKLFTGQRPTVNGQRKKAVHRLPFTVYLIAIAIAGCAPDYLDTRPTTEVTTDEIFKDMQSAEMALNGIYRHFYQYIGAHDQGGHFSVLHAIDLMGEDLFPKQEAYGWFVSDYNYTGSRNVNSARISYFWSFYYDIVNNANIIIAQLPGVPGTDAVKSSMLGQSLALRAFGHFMAVQLFAKTYAGNEDAPGVPVYTEPTEVGKARATVGAVYAQIVADLDTAIVKLKGVTVPNKSYIGLAVAKGLRARVALVMNDWENAEKYAREARTGIHPMTAAEYKSGFNSASNEEWMWGSIINVEQSIVLASLYSHLDPTAGGYASYGNEKYVLKQLYNRIGANDARKAVFLYNKPKEGPNYLGVKFHLAGNSWAGDYVYMRAAEMYLIEAEAIAQRGGRATEVRKLLEDLVKTRDESYTAPSYGSLLDEIYLQRRIELWGEGFRWLDLKRQEQPLERPTASDQPNVDKSGLHETSLARVTDIPAGDVRWTLLIPQDEMDANPLMEQNPLSNE